MVVAVNDQLQPSSASPDVFSITGTGQSGPEKAHPNNYLNVLTRR